LVAGDLRRVLDVAVEVIAVPNEMVLAGLWALVESRRSPTSDGTCSCTPGSTLWVPNTALTALDLPIRHLRATGMIGWWRCG
jgi:hypothetical protein